MADREHEFDHNGGVAIHKPECWCTEWEQRVREAAARQKKITDTEPDDESETPWWKK